MVRKQLYISAEQQKKLHRVASLRRCSEAEVVRSAIDRLPDSKGSILERLEVAGLLISPPDDDEIDKLSHEVAEALEVETMAWLDAQTAPLGLSEVILEDRR